MDDTKSGVYRKFRVSRVDESKKHDGCEYFVLDWKHDKYMPFAIESYANACESEFPALASDLRKLLEYYHPLFRK